MGRSQVEVIVESWEVWIDILFVLDSGGSGIEKEEGTLRRACRDSMRETQRHRSTIVPRPRSRSDIHQIDWGQDSYQFCSSISPSRDAYENDHVDDGGQTHRKGPKE